MGRQALALKYDLSTHFRRGLLYEFFSFLEENNLELQQIDQTQIAIWRNAMLDRGLMRSTVNARIRLVSDFYRWTLRRHMIK